MNISLKNYIFFFVEFLKCENVGGKRHFLLLLFLKKNPHIVVSELTSL